MILKSPVALDEDLLVKFNSESFDSPFEHEKLYASSNYKEALIDGSGGKSNFIRPEVYLNGRMVACGCFQELVLYKEDLDEMGRLFGGDGKLSIKIESLFKALVNCRNGRKGLRILIAGNAQISGSYGMFFRPEVGEELQAKIWAEVINQCEISFGPFSIHLIKDFTEDQGFLIQEFRKGGFRKLQSLPIMTMSISSDWNTFKDYLAAMSSKYRIRAKAARKKGLGLKRQTWGVDEIAAQLPEIEELYRNVYNKARFRLFRINANYFLKLKENLGDKMHFNAYLVDNQLKGFSTFIFHDDQADAHLIGIDYEANQQYSLYQNMLYDYIELGIEKRVPRIDFGRTAMEIKSTVGAVPEYLHVLVKIKNPLLNSLTGILVNSEPKPDWIQRHPFK